MSSAIERAITIEDLRRLAKRRLPRVVFDYIDGAAEREITLRRNSEAFERIVFRPKSAVASAPCTIGATVVGTQFDLPFLLAPVGSSRMFWPKGECVAARCAGDAGTGYILSTLSGCAMEDVAASTHGPKWFQLYIIGGQSVAMRAIERAKAAGFSALVVTIDTPVAGLRERDVRGGAKELVGGNPFKIAPYAGQILSKPSWLAGFLADGGLMKFPNILLDDGPMGYEDAGAALGDSAVDLRDFEWIRRAWNGPLIAKGVHTAEDARRVVDAGADAVVVSNHGGRQLDGVAATIEVLPEVVAAVGGEVDVLLDSGIRRGSDIVKALCLGARAVLVGRAYAYGLGAAGAAGVRRAIEILRDDVARTLNLLGCHDVAELNDSFVR
ncbi:MAG TPA: alpha-hydroxy acid oxidase [Candidatus Aquilonibacter sp.]|nr:alpha-hydroxy acid oxidase [Candidatus Aquilonibacter sp.]